MTITTTPQTRVPIRCRLGLHDCVDLPPPKNKMARMFIVRRSYGCRRCGAVYTVRFNNALAGGGTIFCGYVDPNELAPPEAPK